MVFVLPKIEEEKENFILPEIEKTEVKKNCILYFKKWKKKRKI